MRSGAAMSTVSSHSRLTRAAGGILAFAQRGSHVAARFDRDEIEERQGEVFDLRDIAPRRARQRAEGRYGRTEQAVGLAGLALDRDLPEIGR